MRRLLRSRAFRVLAWLMVLPLWQVLEILSDNDLRAYTATGDVIGLTLWMLFALFAWWYAEDRDRRRSARAAQGDGAAPSDRDGR